MTGGSDEAVDIPAASVGERNEFNRSEKFVDPPPEVPGGDLNWERSRDGLLRISKD